MSERKIVHTAYGDIEIDVVECASCGNEVAKKDAVDFVIGDQEKLACQHCAEEGPINFPSQRKKFSIKNKDGFILMSVLFAPVFIPISTLIGISNQSNDFSEGYATAVLSILTWTVFIILMYNWIML